MQNIAQGGLAACRETLAKNKKDQAASQYDGIDLKHLKQQVRVKTYIMTISDLGIYHAVSP